MPIVNTALPVTSQNCTETIRALLRRYPFCRSQVLGSTVFQRPLTTLVIGNGPRTVLFAASFHANEWITTLVLLQFAQELAEAIDTGTSIGGQDGQAIAQACTIHMLPLVNPDGVDLVTGGLLPGHPQYTLAQSLAQNYPQIPFPSGWKANLLGVDLNLQWPAGWQMAQQIKFAQGYTLPGPRDYVGQAPLNQLEAQALARYTQTIDPALVLAYHTQGQEIYWQFMNYQVPGAEALGEKMAKRSGYRLADTPYASSFAGYKDWFIQHYRRPGYTIEAGLGENPLPLSQFDAIYRDNLPILLTAALGA